MATKKAVSPPAGLHFRQGLDILRDRAGLDGVLTRAQVGIAVGKGETGIYRTQQFRECRCHIRMPRSLRSRKQTDPTVESFIWISTPEKVNEAAPG